MLAGKWYTIGKSADFRTCECPSVYPLPAATPGTEAAYRAATGKPNVVHKTSCGGDWWQLGTYTEGAPKTLGNFSATAGWDDLFAQRKIDQGNFYASKDNEYPTLTGGKRRINWGWATVPPASTQTLPREVTFNAEARALQQYPIEELKALRGDVAYDKSGVPVSGTLDLGLDAGVARQSEVLVSFALPSAKATLGVTVGSASGSGTSVLTYMNATDLGGNDYNITHMPPHTAPSVCEAACAADDKCEAWTYVIRGALAGSGDCCLKSGGVPCPKGNADCTSGAKKKATLPGCSSAEGITCTIDYTPGATTVPVECGGTQDTLTLLPSESSIELRIFSDWTFIEAYFQRGRVAITKSAGMSEDTKLLVTSTTDVTADISAFPMKSIWVDPAAVRSAPRVYH